MPGIGPLYWTKQKERWSVETDYEAHKKCSRNQSVQCEDEQTFAFSNLINSILIERKSNIK